MEAGLKDGKGRPENGSHLGVGKHPLREGSNSAKFTPLAAHQRERGQRRATEVAASTASMSVRPWQGRVVETRSVLLGGGRRALLTLLGGT